MASVTVCVNSSTSTGPSYTITLTATLDAAITDLTANNIEAWVTYDGTQISNTINLSPTLGQPKVWTGTVTNVGGVGGNQIWVVVFVSPPDDSQPFSGSVKYSLPDALRKKPKKPRAKAEKA